MHALDLQSLTGIVLRSVSGEATGIQRQSREESQKLLVCRDSS